MAKVKNKKKFSIGLVMLIGFLGVVVLAFMPVWGSGKNLFNLTDDLYNSVSKGSSDMIPEVEEKTKKYDGTQVSFKAKGTDAKMAQQMVDILKKDGIEAKAEDKTVKVSGDLGVIFQSVNGDSRLMFDNDGAAISGKYNLNEKEVMNDWWNLLNSSEKDFTAQEQFEIAKSVREVREKSVEPAYNYYTIDAKSPSSMAIPIALSLGGYILYTLWYGFALLFMFEGWGLKMEH